MFVQFKTNNQPQYSKNINENNLNFLNRLEIGTTRTCAGFIRHQAQITDQNNGLCGENCRPLFT